MKVKLPSKSHAPFIKLCLALAACLLLMSLLFPGLGEGHRSPTGTSLEDDGNPSSSPEHETGQEGEEGEEGEPSPEAQEAAYKFYATSLLWLFIGALIALAIILIAIKRRN